MFAVTAVLVTAATDFEQLLRVTASVADGIVGLMPLSAKLELLYSMFYWKRN